MGYGTKKKPTEKILEHIREHYKYNPDTGHIVKDCKPITGIRITINISDPIYYGAIQYGTRAHNIGWYLTHGVWPDKYIDHIDGDHTNNKLSNLRLATSGQNVHNMRKVSKKTTSKYKGVKKVNKRWRAYINLDYKMIHLGYYDTEEEAAKVYDMKAKELHGEFACLNFGTDNAVDRINNVEPCSERYYISTM